MLSMYIYIFYFPKCQILLKIDFKIQNKTKSTGLVNFSPLWSLLCLGGS